MGPLHETTGIPMECIVIVETEADQTLLVHGSYHATWRLYDKLIVTNRETYLYDILAGTLCTESGTAPIESEQDNCARVIVDFLDAVKQGRPPRAAGPSVLPAMRVLQQVQDEWDRHYGAQPTPAAPVSTVSAQGGQ
jgi:2-hydroxy-4-carboxymuconate semialdehyde hemiacetal dehydrogenase